MMAAAEAKAVRNRWDVVIAILNDGGPVKTVFPQATTVRAGEENDAKEL
jgi:uncharacterized protein GlcG (DUF336 family)